MSVDIENERKTVTCNTDEFTVKTSLDSCMMIKDKVLYKVTRN
jgi:hypothetical protein